MDLVLARWHVLCHSVCVDPARSVGKAVTPPLRRLRRATVGPGCGEWRDRCARRTGARGRRVARGVWCRGRRHRRRNRRHLGNGNRTLEHEGAAPHHDMADRLPRGPGSGYSARHGGRCGGSSTHRLGSGILGAGYRATLSCRSFSWAGSLGRCSIAYSGRRLKLTTAGCPTLSSTLSPPPGGRLWSWRRGISIRLEPLLPWLEIKNAGGTSGRVFFRP